MPDGARQKIAGSIWFPGPKTWRKIEVSWPDWAIQHQILCLFVIKVKFWRFLVQSGQIPSSFLQTSGPGSQTEPATFSSGSVWHDFVWLSGPWCSQGISLPPLDRLFSAPWSSKSADFFSFHLEFWVSSFSFFLVLLGHTKHHVFTEKILEY